MLERVPIRWRLAGTTAILTFAILCTFALVVGELTQDRIRSDFEHDVAAGAINLRDDISVRIENDGTWSSRRRRRSTCTPVAGTRSSAC